MVQDEGVQTCGRLPNRKCWWPRDSYTTNWGTGGVQRALLRVICVCHVWTLSRRTAGATILRLHSSVAGTRAKAPPGRPENERSPYGCLTISAAAAQVQLMAWHTSYPGISILGSPAQFTIHPSAIF